MPILSIDFCPSCGGKIKTRIPADDNRERAVCVQCDTIHYQNPKTVVGTLPVWEDKVLLCKRAIEPRYGSWTLPAGFMENGESVETGALRETWEEAEAKLNNLQFFTMFSVPRISQIYIIFRADLTGENAFAPGSESLETALFAEHEIPWDEISFPMIKRSLRYFFRDRKAGQFGVHVEDM